MPLLGVAWLFAVASGLGLMMAYQATPGAVTARSTPWPKGSRIQPATDRATLILLAHPQCPCTRASIGELNELMAQSQGKAAVYVLYWKPKGAPKNWEKTDLWYNAAAIPGVQTLVDEGGQEARRFHMSTSGQTLLFDASQQLIFSGGITAARGQVGDNVGRDAVVSLLNTGKARFSKTPVFGCSVLTPSS